MTKQEILEALLLAKEAYEKAINAEFDFDDDGFNDYFFFLVELNTDAGICDYIRRNWDYTDRSNIVDELAKDIVVARHSNMYWYPSPGNLYTNEQISNEGLQPRLNHLQRTIARLQSELQTSNALRHA